MGKPTDPKKGRFLELVDIKNGETNRVG